MPGATLTTLLTVAALQGPVSVSALEGGTLVGATRAPQLRAWSLADLAGSRDLLPPGPGKPRVSALSLTADRLYVATDWGADVEERRRADDALLRRIPSGGKRVVGVLALPDGRVAMRVQPAVASTDPDAAGTGPAQVVVVDPEGARATLLLPAGAEALALDAAGLLWVLDGDGRVRSWTGRADAAAPGPALDSGLEDHPRALAVGLDGRHWAASSEAVCVVGGSCSAADGGAGALAIGDGWVAVGGFSDTVVLDAATRAERLRVPGRPAGLYRLDDGALLVVGGDALTWVDPGRGAVTRRAALP